MMLARLTDMGIVPMGFMIVVAVGLAKEALGLAAEILTNWKLTREANADELNSKRKD